MISIKRLKKYLRIGTGRIIQDLRTRFYLKTGLFMPFPERIYYFMTSRCNFHCKMCPEWKLGLSENPDNLISEERMREIIDKMKELGFRELGFSGGEPLLEREKLLRLIRRAHANGIYTHIATNGSLLDAEFLAEYDRLGGGHISLSIDALGKKHDELRGFAGAYSGVERALALFESGKYPSILLKINFTLTDENFSQAASVGKMAMEKGAVIFFQPYDPYDYGRRGDTLYLENRYPLWIRKENYSLLELALNGIKALKRKYPGTVLNSEEHLSDIFRYFKGQKNTGRFCYAGLDQLSVFPGGDVVFCKFGRVGNLKNISLGELIKSPERLSAVGKSLQCRENCLLGCQYRPGFFDLMKNGAKQLIKLSAVKK